MPKTPSRSKKPPPKSPAFHRIELRLEQSLTARFDKVRGLVGRAPYIRNLIEKDIAAKKAHPKETP